MSDDHTFHEESNAIGDDGDDFDITPPIEIIDPDENYYDRLFLYQNLPKFDYIRSWWTSYGQKIHLVTELSRISQPGVQQLSTSISEEFQFMCTSRAYRLHLFRRNLNYGSTIQSVEFDDYQLIRMRDYLINHVDEIDWSHPAMIAIVQYAAESNDHPWFRLLVEFGADITQIDQGSLFHLSYHPHGRIKEDDDSFMTMIKYLMEILDINIHYVCHRCTFTIEYQPLIIEDTILLSYLLLQCGHIIDFCNQGKSIRNTNEYSAIDMVIPPNLQLLQFMSIIYENGLLAIPNTLMIKTILPKGFCCLNSYERNAVINQQRDRILQRHSQLSDMADINGISTFMRGIFHMFSHKRHFTELEIGIEEEVLAFMNILVNYYLDPQTHPQFPTWFFCDQTDKMLYWSPTSLASTIIFHSGKMGNSSLICKIFNIFNFHTQSLSGNDDDNTITISRQGIIKSILQSTIDIDIISLIINDIRNDITLLSSLQHRKTDIVTLIVCNINDNYDVDNEHRVVDCIRLLMEHIGTSFVIRDDHAMLLLVCISCNRWYILNALLNLVYGYDLSLDTQACVNINDHRIVYKGSHLNLLALVIRNYDSSHYRKIWQDCYYIHDRYLKVRDTNQQHRNPDPNHNLLDMTKMVIRLLDHHTNIDVNAPMDEHGNTILHYSIMQENSKLFINFVGGYQADLNRKNNQGVSPTALVQSIDKSNRPSFTSRVSALIRRQRKQVKVSNMNVFLKAIKIIDNYNPVNTTKDELIKQLHAI